MTLPDNFREKIFDLTADFDSLAVALWEYQRRHNPVLREFCALREASTMTFLPISCFKTFELQTGDWDPEVIFESSGTTGQRPSRHLVRDRSWYRRVHRASFFHFYPQKNYRILALLPNYLERGNSSLVAMVSDWIEDFGTAGSGFFLRDFARLKAELEQAASRGESILLIGVAFALLDFVAEYGPLSLPGDAVVLETGGMKGRRAEMVRDDLHAALKRGLGAAQIGSEYGMTELMSQMYAPVEGRFFAPPWLRVVISDMHLPSLAVAPGATGRINFIDLANVDSCAFISTDDLGRTRPDGSFEVLGRIDFSEMRGCSLLYA